MTPRTFAVSVVIPTRGRPDLLERCLTAVLDQDFDKSAYEVVVADDGPSVETRDAVECFWTSPLDALVIGPFLLEKPGALGERRVA